MPMLNIPSIERRLSEFSPVRLDGECFDRRAAVAAVLRDDGDETQLLFIKRAKRPGSVFSGHMAFPGGHWEQGDQDLAATAMRETHEEIGLDLGVHARLLGHLDHMRVNPVGTSYDMLVVPYVFALQGELPRLQLNHEVAAVHWGKMRKMFDGQSATRRGMRIATGTHDFSGFEVEGEIVWGLTFQMVQGLFRMLSPDWRPRTR
jgi:8-oxo-dGTP pyrophosphatase MutT (NUDIX family)